MIMSIWMNSHNQSIVDDYCLNIVDDYMSILTNPFTLISINIIKNQIDQSEISQNKYSGVLFII